MQNFRHKNLIEDQEERLDEIHNIAQNLKGHAEDIDIELSKQTKIFRKVNDEMTKT